MTKSTSAGRAPEHRLDRQHQERAGEGEALAQQQQGDEHLRRATPESEGRLLHMAKNASAAQLETICRGVEQVTSRTREGQSRWVKLRRCSDGMVRLEARLLPDEAALVMKAIDAAVEEAPSPDGPDGPDASHASDASAEALPPSEARPDGVVRVAEAFLAGQRPGARPGGERHQIIVCVREDPLVPGSVSAEASSDRMAPPSSSRSEARGSRRCLRRSRRGRR